MRIPVRGLISGLSCAGWLLALMPNSAGAQWLDFEVPERPQGTPALAEAGESIYAERCWFCHGDEGDGEGPVAPYLWPKPRDFTAGSYKLRTTESGELPTDEDLFRTVSLGIPGTAMPEWRSELTDQERWQVIAYVKSFAADLFEDEEFDPYKFVIELTSEGGDAADSAVDRGGKLFREADCWECHGDGGRGDGEKAAELDDDWDFPIVPADLRLGWKFKGGSSQRDVYLRLSGGLDGTPMPSYSATLSEEERWQLASYVAALVKDTESARSSGAVITGHRIDGEVPKGPDDPTWESAPEVFIPLSGQATYPPRWQIPAITDLAVRVVYNDREIAFRLAWDDRWADTLPADSARARADGWEADDTYPVLYPDRQRIRGQYPDAAEVMFPLRHEGASVLPHFVYGNAGQPVDLWRWQADVQATRGAAQAVTELRASGTRQAPEPHSLESQQASGEGAWRDGRWTVVIRRSLTTGEGSDAVQLRPGQYVPVAFHAWEGANGETGLRMAISSWYFVHLREPVSATSYLVVFLTVVLGFGMELGLARWMGTRAQVGRLAHYGIPAAAVDQ